jgi:hypothetical protein
MLPDSLFTPRMRLKLIELSSEEDNSSPFIGVEVSKDDEVTDDGIFKAKDDDSVVVRGCWKTGLSILIFEERGVDVLMAIFNEDDGILETQEEFGGISTLIPHAEQLKLDPHFIVVETMALDREAFFFFNRFAVVISFSNKL